MWFAIAAVCTVATFYSSGEFDNPWLGVVSTIVVCVFALPLLFFLVLVYYRFLHPFLRPTEQDTDGTSPNEGHNG